MAFFFLAGGLTAALLVNAEANAANRRAQYDLYGRRYSSEIGGPFGGVLTVRILDARGIKPSKKNKVQSFYVSGSLETHVFDPGWSEYHYYQLGSFKTKHADDAYGEPNFMQTFTISFGDLRIYPPSKLLLILSVRRKRSVIRDKKIGRVVIDITRSFSPNSHSPMRETTASIQTGKHGKEAGKLHLGLEFVPKSRRTHRRRNSAGYRRHSFTSNSQGRDIPYGQPAAEDDVGFTRLGSPQRDGTHDEVQRVCALTHCNRSMAQDLLAENRSVSGAVRAYYTRSSLADQRAHPVRVSLPENVEELPSRQVRESFQSANSNQQT